MWTAMGKNGGSPGGMAAVTPCDKVNRKDRFCIFSSSIGLKVIEGLMQFFFRSIRLSFGGFTGKKTRLIEKAGNHASQNE